MLPYATDMHWKNLDNTFAPSIKLTGISILYHTIDTAITRKIIHFNYHRPIISTTCTSTKLWIYHGNMKHSSLKPHPSSPLPILYGIPSTVHLCQLFWSQDVFWQDETTGRFKFFAQRLDWFRHHRQTKSAAYDFVGSFLCGDYTLW